MEFILNTELNFKGILFNRHTTKYGINDFLHPTVLEFQIFGSVSLVYWVVLKFDFISILILPSCFSCIGNQCVWKMNEKRGKILKKSVRRTDESWKWLQLDCLIITSTSTVFLFWLENSDYCAFFFNLTQYRRRKAFHRKNNKQIYIHPFVYMYFFWRRFYSE